MKDTNLGELPPEGANRDAIHVAIIPVVADVRVYPGEKVGVTLSGRATPACEPIGIIDPFLRRKFVDKDERVWLLLFPQTITGMRHHWSHPSFADVENAVLGSCEKDKAEQWLRAFADECGIDFDYMISEVKTGTVCFGNDDYPDNPSAEFASNYTLYTGLPVGELYFRCAC